MVFSQGVVCSYVIFPWSLWGMTQSRKLSVCLVQAGVAHSLALEESWSPEGAGLCAGRHSCWAGETRDGKPSLQQPSELQTPFTFILTHFDSSLRQRVLCSLLLTKPSSWILVYLESSGRGKGPGGSLEDSSWLEAGLPREAPAPVGTGLLQVARSPMSSQTARVLLPLAWTCLGLARTPCARLLGHGVRPLRRQDVHALTEGLAEPSV